MEDSSEKRRDMVCLDDTSRAPDLHDVAEVDAPFVLLVCYVDDAHSLDVGSETSAIDCETQVFDESFLFGGGGECEF